MRCYERIREIREDNEYKQMLVAEVLHVSQSTYCDYEHGRVRIPLDCLIDLARFYDVNLDYLSGISDIKNQFPKK